jgi:hypothetical protein
MEPEQKPSEFPAQFPQLTETGPNFHYHVSIDKSVKTAAWWLVLTLIITIFVLGAATSMLYIAQREWRLDAAAKDDKRLENRAAWKQLGVDGIALEDHDISDILKEVRKKHPLKEE